MDLALSAAVILLISFLAVLLSTPRLMRKLQAENFVSQDYNKAGRPFVPKFGGIAIVFGFSLAALASLKLLESGSMVHMLAALSTILLIAFIGLMDDLLKLSDRWRVILPAFAALPLMVTRVGVSSMDIPFAGDVNFGIWYSLLLVPLGVVAASNLVNLLAGFNGLEAGSGAIATLSVLAVALVLGRPEPAFLMAAMLGACAAFLLFNWHPAKIFPGNVATYVIGASIVGAVVLGNFEKVGVIALTPQIIEFALKARSGFQAENFGEIRAGRLTYRGKICSLTHLLMRLFKPTEKQLVLMLLLLQALFGWLAIRSVL